MEEKINILLTFNNNYFDEVKILLSSLKLYNNYNFTIYVIYTDLTKKNIADLEKFVKSKIGNIKFYNITNLIEKLELKVGIEHITKEAYYRLFAPYIIDDKIDKILYLDCDTIINGDILDLYNTSLGNNIIAGVVNFDFLSRNYNLRLNLPIDNNYINSGVLLINLKKYKKYISLNKILEYIDLNMYNLVFPDQDIINYIFYNKIKLVDTDYNYQIVMLDDDIAYEKAKIIHYSYKYKPWNNLFPYLNKGKNYYDLLDKIGKTKLKNRLVYMHKKSYEREKYQSSDYNVTLSIIVPICKNSKKNLTRCLNSIKNQRLYDIEILLICNKNNLDICNKFILTDDRFKIILDENEELFNAENIGINEATGKYITFVDCNDYVDEDIYLKSLDYMFKNKLRLVFINYFDIYKDTIDKNRIRFNCDEIISGVNMYDEIFLEDKLSNFSWCKIVDSNTLKANKLEYKTRNINILNGVIRLGFIHTQMYYHVHNKINKYNYDEIKNKLKLYYDEFILSKQLPNEYQKNSLFNFIKKVTNLYVENYKDIDKKLLFKDFNELFDLILKEYKMCDLDFLKTFEDKIEIIIKDKKKYYKS